MATVVHQIINDFTSSFDTTTNMESSSDNMATIDFLYEDENFNISSTNQPDVDTRTAMFPGAGVRWSSAAVLVTSSILGLLANGFTIHVVSTHARFRKPQYTVMVMFAIVNIGMCRIYL